MFPTFFLSVALAVLRGRAVKVFCGRGAMGQIPRQKPRSVVLLSGVVRTRSGNRTRTTITGHRILSPACLPIPPSEPLFCAKDVGKSTKNLRLAKILMLNHRRIVVGNEPPYRRIAAKPPELPVLLSGAMTRSAYPNASRNWQGKSNRTFLCWCSKFSRFL